MLRTASSYQNELVEDIEDQSAYILLLREGNQAYNFSGQVVLETFQASTDA